MRAPEQAAVRAAQLLRARYDTLEPEERQLVRPAPPPPPSAQCAHPPLCSSPAPHGWCTGVPLRAPAGRRSRSTAALPAAQVKAAVMAWVRGAGAGPGQQPAFLRNKIAQVLACMVQVRSACNVAAAVCFARGLCRGAEGWRGCPCERDCQRNTRELCAACSAPCVTAAGMRKYVVI